MTALVPGDDPILRRPSEEFDFTTDDPENLSDLLESAMQHYNGLGLSAVQLGIPKRAFAMRTNPDITVFNPRIVDASEELVSLDEGCLSYPGIVLSIKRPRMIRVRFQNKNRETVTLKLDGMTSRIFQHELDHLNGVRHVDRVGRIKLFLAMKRAKKAGHDYRIGELL